MNIILEIINYALILTFGVLVSVSFCTTNKTLKNNMAIFILIICELILQLICWIIFGFEITANIYPLITHVPLFLFIVFYLKKPCSIAIFSILTAYLCCQTPNWIGYFFMFMVENKSEYYIIAKSLAIIPTYLIIKRYISASILNMMTYSKKSLYLFGSLPLLYYLFDYTTKINPKLLHGEIKVVAEFLPFIVSIFYLVVVVTYYDEVQKRNKVELDNMVLSTQSDQAKNEIESLKKMQKQTAIYRHDMRHHLSMISNYISDKNFEEAIAYIKQTQSDIDSITPQRYCDNTAINLILSSFFAKAKTNDVLLLVDAEVSKDLSISETEICSLLSNGLENAIKAASKIEEIRKRIVRINCKIYKSNLLISMENPFVGNIILENGLPVSNDLDHGFGVKSIAAIVEKHDGYYSFESKDKIFTLRVALPLAK